MQPCNTQLTQGVSSHSTLVEPKMAMISQVACNIPLLRAVDFLGGTFTFVVAEAGRRNLAP